MLILGRDQVGNQEIGERSLPVVIAKRKVFVADAFKGRSNWKPKSPWREVKIGFSLLRSPESVRFEVQLVPRKCGFR